MDHTSSWLLPRSTAIGWLNEEDTMSSKHLWWGPFTSTFCEHWSYLLWNFFPCICEIKKWYSPSFPNPPWLRLRAVTDWRGGGASALTPEICGPFLPDMFKSAMFSLLINPSIFKITIVRPFFSALLFYSIQVKKSNTGLVSDISNVYLKEIILSDTNSPSYRSRPVMVFFG